MTGFGTTTDSTDITLQTNNSVEWVERECDRCGEEFTTLAILASNADRQVCSDCDTGPLGLNIPSDIIGGKRHWHLAVNRPLMEYGPLSEGRYP